MLSEEVARRYQVASALYEVLRDVTNNKVDSEVLLAYCCLRPCASLVTGNILLYNLPNFVL